MVTTQDGVGLHVEEAGDGVPVLFVHEFAGDHRSWRPQLRWFARRYRAIAYAARGYPPSDVPGDLAAYSQDHAVDDAVAVLDGLGIGRAHIVGLSMGGFVALHLARRHPDRCRSIVAAGVGYGARPETTAGFRRECDAIADAIDTDGVPAFAARYAVGPARVQFENKDPLGHAEFAAQLAEHNQGGAARTMRGFQRERPSLYDFADDWRAVRVPAVIVAGDEDEASLEPSLWLKRTIPTAGLAVLPRTGHTINLEEPAAFNALVADFLAAVDAGRWAPRDPRSLATSTTGIE
ncbi:MAG: alpha/beta fold hydrolase [Nitriliruptorales bacterium]|nr:alpha/beta fold hydrolase [Nitriliruptorales bacterium]